MEEENKEDSAVNGGQAGRASAPIPTGRDGAPVPIAPIASSAISQPVSGSQQAISESEVRGIETILFEMKDLDGKKTEETMILSCLDRGKEDENRFLRRPDFADTDNVRDMVKVEEDYNNRKQQIFDGCPALARSVSDGNGYLKPIDDDCFQGCINLRVGNVNSQTGKKSFDLIGFGGQYAVFGARLEEDKLGYDAYKNIWCRIKGYEILEEREGHIDNIRTYVAEAASELEKELENEIERTKEKKLEQKRKYSDAIDKSRISLTGQEEKDSEEEAKTVRKEMLRRKILGRYGRESIFPNEGKCAIKISHRGSAQDKSVAKDLHTWGLIDETAIIMPITGKTTNKRTYMVMDLIENPMTLRQIREETTLYDKIEFTLRVNSFIGRLWKMGCVHRDIKPSNIMISKRPDGSYDVKVTDFGIMRMYKEGGGIDSDKTIDPNDTNVVGTEDYLAPEIIWKRLGKVDNRTDMYCLISTLYTWLTGKSSNPVQETAYKDMDRFLKCANAGLEPSKRWKPVDPLNAINPKDKYNLTERYAGFKEWFKNWGRRWNIWHDFNNLRLVMAKAMSYEMDHRYLRNEDFAKDLEAVMSHEKPPIVRAELNQCITEAYVENKKENGEVERIPLMIDESGKKVYTMNESGQRVYIGKKKAHIEWYNGMSLDEYVQTTFSRIDPFYERDLGSDHVQRRLRWERIEKYCMYGFIAAGAFTAGILIAKFYDALEKMVFKWAGLD
jgi:serine/threonine protein kinase